MKAWEVIAFLKHFPDADVCVRERDGGPVLEVYNVVKGAGEQMGRVILQFEPKERR